MTASGSGLTPRSAYLLHFALVMSLAVITGVFWIARDTVHVDLTPIVSRTLRYVAVLELVATGFIISRIRSAMPLQVTDEDVETWWSNQGGRVAVTWALSHAAATTGAVFWLMTDDTLILAAVVVASLLVLLRLGPGHWRAEAPRQTRLVP